MYQKLLEDIGLTKSEIKTYFALLSLGETTTGPLIDKAGISHSKIYSVLEKLISKGLVSKVTKGKTLYFEAASPTKILVFLGEEKKKIADKENQLKQILPELLKKKTFAKPKQGVRVFEGIDGLKTVFDEMLQELKRGETFFTFGVPSTIPPIRRYFIKFHKKRTQKDIRHCSVYNLEAKSLVKERDLRLGEVRFVPEGIVTSAVTVLYHDKVIIDVATVERPITIVITNKEIAHTYKTQFELLWKMALKLKTKLN